MLAADPVALEAAGFEAIDWNGHAAYAAPGKWILRLEGPEGPAGKQLAGLDKLIKRVAGSGLKATAQLGSDGLVLIESDARTSFKNVHRALSKLTGFASLQPDFAIWSDATTPTDTFFRDDQWSLNNTGQSGGKVDADIDAPEAWDRSKGFASGGNSVVVGVIDSGVEYTHPDLAANMWKNPGETPGDRVDNDGNGYVDDVYGYDFLNDDSDPRDDNGHGTHVAGTIAAASNNALGVSGVSWGAKVMALKFLGADGTGTTSAAIAAVNYATEMKTRYGVNVRVTNNSWGGGGYSSALRDAIAAHADAGILFVAAAGNGGDDHAGDDNDATPQYPAGYAVDNILSVAASDHADALGSFSNYGDVSVDLAAPGVDVLSTYLDGQYAYLSGTSMATPHVSGVAALAAAYKPTASYQAIRTAILKGVDAVASLAGKVATGGRLNAAKALSGLSLTAAPTALTATATSSSRIDLAWADNSSLEHGFNVYRSGDGGATYTRVGTVGGNVRTYAATGLVAGKTYRFVVRAYNAGGESSASNTATATTPGVSVTTTTPAAPTTLAAGVVDDDQVNLTWSDRSTNETGFKIERKTGSTGTWAQVAAVGAGVTRYDNRGLAALTKYHYRVRAYNGAGNSGYSAETSALTNAAGIFTGKRDVGAVATVGSATYDAAAKSYTLKGSGTDIAGAADEFRYAYKKLAGDGSITVRVASLLNTNGAAKAGVMFRETTATGSRNALLAVTPTSGVVFQRRATTGGGTSVTTKSGLAAPRWLRLTRTGSGIKAYYSGDGRTWVQVGTTATVPMAAEVYVGLAVTSRRDGTLTTAKFDNVTIARPTTAVAASRSIFSGTRVADASEGLDVFRM